VWRERDRTRRDALDKLRKKVEQDASRRCARRPGGSDRDPFFVQRPTQTDQDECFGSPVCVGPLEMPLEHVYHTWKQINQSSNMESQ
jgi:hypothetical protein